jgi:hypothetical protein
MKKKDREKRISELENMGLLGFSHKRADSKTTARRKKGVLIAVFSSLSVLGIVLILIGGAIAWGRSGSKNSLWQWVPNDALIVWSVDLSLSNEDPLQSVLWGNGYGGDRGLLQELDSWLHEYLSLEDSYPILKGKKLLMYFEAETHSWVIGMKGEPDALSVLENMWSQSLSDGGSRLNSVELLKTTPWIKPAPDTIFFSQSEAALSRVSLKEEDETFVQRRPQSRFSLSYLTNRPIIEAFLTTKGLFEISQGSEWDEMIHVLAAKTGEWWLQGVAQDNQIQFSLFPAQEESSFVQNSNINLPEGVILSLLNHRIDEIAYQQNSQNSLFKPLIEDLEAQLGVSLLSTIQPWITGPGAIFVVGESEQKVVLALSEQGQPIDGGALEDEIRTYLARLAPEKVEVELPDGSFADEYRASETAFSWEEEKYRTKEGIQVMIRSIPENPRKVTMAYAQVRSTPGVFILAQRKEDIKTLLSDAPQLNKYLISASKSPGLVVSRLDPAILPETVRYWLRDLQAVSIQEQGNSAGVNMFFQF